MVARIANQQWLSMNIGFYKFVFIRSGADAWRRSASGTDEHHNNNQQNYRY